MEGADYNILFERRVLYDKVTPENGYLTAFPAGTFDNTVIDYYIANHLDLNGDGLSTSLVQHVGTPSTDTEIQAGAGWTWSAFMRWITSVTGAIYYIRPDKEVVHTDVETADAPFGISDDPTGGEIGCRDLEIDYNGSNLVNDALVWGAGQGSSSPVFSRSTDTTSITEHGRWQLGAPFQSIWKQATADSVSSTYVYGSPQSLRGGKDDQISARCSVYTAGLVCGQKVPLRSAVFGFTKTIPIRMLKITFPTKEDVKWDLTLSHEIDQPWTGFDAFPFPPLPPFPAFDIPGFPSFDPCVTGPGYSTCFNFADAFPTANYTPGWGPNWSLVNGIGGGNNTHTDPGSNGMLFDRGTDTAGGGFIDTQSTLSTNTCLAAAGTSIVVMWNSNGDFTNNTDLLAHTGTDYWGPQGSITGGIFNQKAVSFSVYGWSGGGSFAPLVTWSVDESGTGYMFLRKHGSAFYFEPYTFTFQEDTDYRVRIVQDTAGTYVKVRQWEYLSTEPTGWQLQDMTLSGNYTRTGALSFSSERYLDVGVTGNPAQIVISDLEVGGILNDSIGTYTYLATGWGSQYWSGRWEGSVSSPTWYGDYSVLTGGRDSKTTGVGIPWPTGGSVRREFSGINIPAGARFARLTGRIEFDASSSDAGLIHSWEIHKGDWEIANNVGGQYPGAVPPTYDHSAGLLAGGTIDANISIHSPDFDVVWNVDGLNAAQWVVRLTTNPSNTISVESATMSIDDPSVAGNFTLRFYGTDPLDCIDSILTPPDPPVGAICENLQRIATPSGVDPSLTYYQTDNVYHAGTTKVWVDGLRLAWYDYDELPDQALIVVHADVGVGGGDVFDPPKGVYACYLGG